VHEVPLQPAQRYQEVRLALLMWTSTSEARLWEKREQFGQCLAEVELGSSIRFLWSLAYLPVPAGPRFPGTLVVEGCVGGVEGCIEKAGMAVVLTLHAIEC
jgi:hypothetical protein